MNNNAILDEMKQAKQEIKRGAAWYDIIDYLNDLQERATAAGLAATFNDIFNGLY